MTILKLCMFALVGVCAAMLLRQWKSDLLPLLRLAMLVGFGTVIFSMVSPLISYLKDIVPIAGLQKNHAEILFKALGIALLTQCCADICKESGESGAASSIEFTGKIEILLLCLPLLEEILSAARDLLNIGT